MGGRRIDRARKVAAAIQACAGVPYDEIIRNDRHVFGAQHDRLKKPAITRAKQRFRRFGDAAYTEARHYGGKTLGFHHKVLVLRALNRCCTTSTKELATALRLAETESNRSFAHSTIDDAIREAGWTCKRVTLYNARRCPYESAATRVALGKYPVE